MLEGLPAPVIVVIVAFIAIDAVIFYFFVRSWVRYSKLMDEYHALQTKGTVLEKDKRSTKNGALYRIKYSFKDWRGKEYKDWQKLPEHRWEILNEEKSVDITYSRDMPRISAFSDRVKSVVFHKRMICIGAGLGLVIIPAIFIGVAITHLPTVR